MSKYILGHRAKTRSAVIRYTVLTAVLLVVVAVLQVSLLSRFRLFGVVPDLMICTVLCLSFFGGRYMGAIVGIAGGFLIEAIGGGAGLVLLPLFYLLFGYLTGHYARAIIPRSYPSYLVYLGFAVILRMALTLLYACMTYQSIRLPTLFVQTLLPEALLTAAVGCLIYFPMLGFFKLLDQRKI